MDEHDWLAEQFEANRTHLRAVAYRMLGSLSEADDAVQEAWLRLSRSDTSDVENLGGWLTTVVARVCLDMLRSRKSRREEPLGAHAARADRRAARTGVDPEHEALLADSVGLALLVVLDTLAPAERLAFVLHDMFAVPFDEIAPIVGRSPTAARQLASRARRRVQGQRPRFPTPISPASAQWSTPSSPPRAAVTSTRCSRCSTPTSCSAPTASPSVRAQRRRARAHRCWRRRFAARRPWPGTFAGRARAAQPALVNGAAGAVWAPGGQPRVVFGFTITQREDRRDRHARRPRAPRRARSCAARRLTNHVGGGGGMRPSPTRGG